MGNDFSCPNLAQYLRRYATAAEAQAMERTLFKRMVFNILMDNTDDHEKNHALVFRQGESPRLAPAFDVLPSCQNPGYQPIGVGDRDAESTLENAMSAHEVFRLSAAQASSAVREVANVVDGWRQHFESLGVSARDIELLSASIDVLSRWNSASGPRAKPKTASAAKPVHDRPMQLTGGPRKKLPQNAYACCCP